MFAQLDTKTVYSFMDSLIDLKTYISKSKELGYKTIGIMDRENLYAAYHFIRQVQQAGLLPILGLELPYRLEEKKIKLYLIAKNSQGYQRLMKISSRQLMGEDGWSEDLGASDLAVIVPYEKELVACDFPFPIYWGLSLDSPQEDYGHPTIPLQTVRYFQEGDREVLRVLHAIRDNLPLKEVPIPPVGQSLRPAGEMAELFSQRFPESMANLQGLVSGISYDFNTDLKLPRFNPQRPAVEELRERAEVGLTTKGLTSSVYFDRLTEELQVIHDMGFDDYFLIVWDLLRFGREQGYYMGMGRGSAAGSLVAYALDITGIDPVKNNLIFERFLNRERYSMPDIDIDLPDIYRSEFLKYVGNKYQTSHTAQIVTFSTFGPKQAIRDVFKRFGVPEYELTNITRKIGFRDSLTSVYDNNLFFRQIIRSKPEYERAFAIAKKIEGFPRQTSIHAAGIVMSDDDLTNHIPIKPGADLPITQYDAPAVEANGLLKMDFLGLRNLTFVQKMAEKLAEDYGVTVDIAKIDLEDQKTLELFVKGQTKGIFQFEQAGAINLLKRIKPAKFEEVVATTSLNRPGASDYIDNFIKRKYGQEPIDLIDDLVAPILAPTYGIMLYQEQVMQIAQIYGGFSLGKADLLRRAMSKKDKAEMARMEADFLAGAKDLGRNLDTARRLYGMMAKFAGYGFNRSHAYAYSALAFQLCYFKAHYPAVFYDVMLNYSSSDYIQDALSRGFKLKKLSLNTIPYLDKIAEQTITLGLHNLRAVPKDLAYWMIDHRPFSSIEDFLTQLPEKYRKEEVLAPLIRIGLFDHFEANRRKVLYNLEPLFNYIRDVGSLFEDASYNWLEIEDFNDSQKYQDELDILGVGISPHPLISLMQQEQGRFTPLSDLMVDSRATILVQLVKSRLIRTKSKGEQMAFLQVSDTRKQLDVTLFPQTFQIYQDQLKDGEFYWLSGRIHERNGQKQMVLDKLTVASRERFWVQLANHDNDKDVLEILKSFPGGHPVVLRFEDSRTTFQLPEVRVAKTPEIEEQLAPFVLKTVFR